VKLLKSFLPAIRRQAHAKLSEEAKLQHMLQNPENMEHQEQVRQCSKQMILVQDRIYA
jgi:hypothetical protein